MSCEKKVNLVEKNLQFFFKWHFSFLATFGQICDQHLFCAKWRNETSWLCEEQFATNAFLTVRSCIRKVNNTSCTAHVTLRLRGEGERKRYWKRERREENEKRERIKSREGEWNRESEGGSGREREDRLIRIVWDTLIAYHWYGGIYKIIFSRMIIRVLHRKTLFTKKMKILRI